MELKTLQLGLLKTNCYLLSSENAAVVIDPGHRSQNTVDFLKENEHKERLILITHAHFDHIGGAEQLSGLTGVKIGVGEGDAPALSDPAVNLSERFRPSISSLSPDLTFSDGETITVGDISFKVIFTPGHTVGGVSYLMGDALFSGDTLFAGSVGRTDFPGGNMSVLKNSVKKLLTLDGDVKVYPGHGEPTTVEFERENNFFVW